MIRLYYAPGACSLAPHIALEEAGAAFEAVRLDFRQGEQRGEAYREINPKARVPALATDRGVLTECLAILAWIARTWPEARLAPLEDAWAMAQVHSFNSFLASSVHVAWAHISRPGRYADGEAAAEAMRAKAPEALGGFFDLIEGRLADGRPYVHGETYTISDPYLMVMTGWIRSRDMVPRARMERVLAHYELVRARPAVVRALEREAAPA
jgi:glutathione S-transferase